MNGGYFMIDCKGLDLLKDSPQTIAGMYKQAQVAMTTNKPIIAYNCMWGNDKSITPIQVFMIQFDGYIIATSSTLQVIIASNDSITINNLIQ